MSGATSIAVTFYGVRGSSPCGGRSVLRYGGNTSCVGVDIDGQDPIILDFGTGALSYGRRQPTDRAFRGNCLLTHAHWDHIQGIPFFPPLLRTPADRITIYAPRSETGASMRATIDSVMAPPLFPVGIADLPGSVDWVEVDVGEFDLGDVRVTARLVPHTGRTLGYRLDYRGASVAYVPDHQQPATDVFTVDPGVRELVTDVGLLIHDAQYTREEFAIKADWGHSTAQYATWLAGEAGARTLALFHHDPLHGDDKIDELLARARTEACGFDVIAATEGCTLEVSP